MSVESLGSKTLRAVLQSLESGSRPKGGVRSITDGIPSIGAEHLNADGGFCFDRIKYIPKEYASRLRRGRIQQGDVLIVKDGATTGKVSYVDQQYPFAQSYVNEHVFICRPSQEVCGKYLFYFLRSNGGNSQIMATFHGAAQGGISSAFADEVYVPLLSLEDQSGIVNYLDDNINHIRMIKSRLEKIPTILKKFRQSVLSAACSGKLTEDWRAENATKSDWDYKVLSDVSESIFTGPFGTMLHKGDYIKCGIPVVNPTNIVNNKIIPDPSVTISIDKAQELSRFILKENDIVLSRRGDLSKCGIVTKREEGWLAGTGTFILRVNINQYFFRMVFQNPATQELIYSGSIGSTMPNLNQGILGALKVPNPSLEEQQEIVNQVQRLFQLADSLEAKYTKTMHRIEKIEQSILAKAFSGKHICCMKYDRYICKN